MEGEADVAYFALVAHAGEEPPSVDAIDGSDALAVEGVQPVVVEIVHAATLQLLVEDAFHVAGLLDGPHGHLAGHGEGIARITLDDGLAQGFLALAAMIGIGGVEVGEAALHEAVGHLLELLHVDARLVIRVGQWQTHESKSEFFHHFSCKF